MPLDEPGIHAITVALVSLAAALSLVSLLVGLISTLTAKDPLPKRIRNLMRRVPASADDFRLRGTSLMLNGAGAMLMASLLGTRMVDPPGPSGYAPAASVTLSNDTTFLISTGVAIAAILSFIGAFGLSVRVRYASNRGSSSAQPGLPPS